LQYFEDYTCSYKTRLDSMTGKLLFQIRLRTFCSVFRIYFLVLLDRIGLLYEV
jgi:hypothetical protein